MTKPLANQTALVTGASRGIGAAIARRLAADGAEVIIHYGASDGPAREVQAAIAEAGGKAHLAKADLATSEGVADLARQVTELLGDRKLDVLANNAGVAEMVPFEETEAEVIDRQYAVNVRAPFLLSKLLSNALADDARIVFTSSVVAKTFFPGSLAYSITKGAVDTLILHLAGHFGPRGIRVNGVAPGVIETDMTRFLQNPEGIEMVKGMQALKRLGQPDDIAGTVAFLAGPDSGWVTGQVIDTSGGSKL